MSVVLPNVNRPQPQRTAAQGLANAAMESFERDREGKSAGAAISKAMLTMTGAAMQGFLPATTAGIEMVDLAPNPNVDLSTAAVPKISPSLKQMLRQEIPLV